MKPRLEGWSKTSNSQCRQFLTVPEDENTQQHHKTILAHWSRCFTKASESSGIQCTYSLPAHWSQKMSFEELVKTKKKPPLPPRQQQQQKNQPTTQNTSDKCLFPLISTLLKAFLNLHKSQKSSEGMLILIMGIFSKTNHFTAKQRNASGTRPSPLTKGKM